MRLILILLCFGFSLKAQELNQLFQQYINSANADQKAELVFDLDNSDRTDWSYFPGGRDGLMLKEMSSNQRKALKNILSQVLSPQGVNKVYEVIRLEGILDMVEGGSGYRDHEKYYLEIYGDPAKHPWAWNFEGHHLSLNFTHITNEESSNTPMFLGANPATVPYGPDKGLRVLKDEEDIARSLVQSLNANQKERAIISSYAPSEIRTRMQEKVDKPKIEGIPVSDLSAQQQITLFKLIDVYVRNMKEAIATKRLNKMKAAGLSSIYFAWAGSTQKGQGHYYKIQGPTFLIEYDNTQNRANHIHAVWRDFEGDFGRDLLKLHYNLSH